MVGTTHDIQSMNKCLEELHPSTYCVSSCRKDTPGRIMDKTAEQSSAYDSVITYLRCLLNKVLYTSVSSPVNCKSYTRSGFLQHILWNSLRTQGPFQRARAGLGDIRTGRTQGPWCRLHSDYYFGIVHTFLFENGLLFLLLFVSPITQTCHVLNWTHHFILFSIKQYHSPLPDSIYGASKVRRLTIILTPPFSLPDPPPNIQSTTTQPPCLI